MNISDLIEKFVSEIKGGEIEIYNEASLQLELAIFLRKHLKGHRIQLERNVTYFGLNKSKFEKKEIDVVILSKDRNQMSAIELKFPRNGQYPEQMFKMCEDVKFLEQLKSGGFQNNFLITFADDTNFWKGRIREGIYAPFRSEEKLKGEIQKPTGEKNKTVNLSGEYTIKWSPIHNRLKFFLVKI